MARTQGARNADYEDRRLDLARQLREALMEDEGLRTSLRQLASRAGVSVATLKHYFEDRDGVLAAVMDSLRIDGAPYLARAASPVSGDVRASLLHFMRALAEAWTRFGVGRMHAAMLAEGLAFKRLGPSYVSLMLEPLLQAGEQFLRSHVDAGRLAPCDLRHASLTLQGPLMLGLLHQDNLSGAGCRPLDLGAFVEAHVDAFLRAFPATENGRANAAPARHDGPRA